MNKIQRTFLFALLICMILLTGCVSDNEQIKAPETLKITAELPENYPKALSKYKVDWYVQDDETAIQNLLHGEIISAEEHKMGVTYRTESDGLNVYSGDMHGGFYYYREQTDRAPEWDEDMFILSKAENEGSKTDATHLRFGGGEMHSYDKADLDFEPQQAVLDTVAEKLGALGLPEVAWYRSEARDADTLNVNREIYNTYAEQYLENGVDAVKIDTPFSEKDEHYVFWYRQMLNGIPFTSKIWERSTRETPTETSVYVRYDKGGIFGLKAENLYVVGDELEKMNIITPQAAIDVYVKEYSKAIHFETTEITNAELNYVVVLDKDGMYARPAWVITMVTEMPVENDPLHETLPENTVIAVSADTGVILERETDTR